MPTWRVTLGSIGAGALLYRIVVRRRILNWGATAAESAARLPGDELLEDADGVATRAITINAPRSARLISRNRFRLPRVRDKLGMIPMEPGSLIMERKMLVGIKQRVERLAAEEKEASHV